MLTLPYFSSLICFAFLISFDVHAFCYYPDGTISDGDTPCNPKQQHSMCCGTQDLCLSDQLCFVSSQNRLRRGVSQLHHLPPYIRLIGYHFRAVRIQVGVRDPARKFVPAQVMGISVSYSKNLISGFAAYQAPASWADVMPCPGSLPGVWFCGYQNVARCNAGPEQKTFGLPSGYIADFRNSTPTATGTVTQQTTFLSTITVHSIHSASGTKGLVTATSCPKIGLAGDSGSIDQICSSNSATQIRIGVGIGTPLAVSLVGALILFFRERRLRKNSGRKNPTGRHIC